MPTISHQKAPKKQIFLLILLVLFSPLAIDIYLPALPEIADSFQVDAALAQDTISWFLFSMGIGQLFAGPLADKLGRRTIALIGISIYCLSALLVWGAQSMQWMLLARLLQGLGACATSVAAFAIVRDVFGAKGSGKMISYLNGAICCIPALAPILGSFLTQSLGWRSNFSFMAGFAVVVGSLMWLSLKETNPATEKQAVFKWARYQAILTTPSFLFHASLCLIAMSVVLSYVTAAPVVLMTDYGLSMNSFTFWFSINAIVNIIACLIAPKMLDIFGSRYTLISGVVFLVLAGISLFCLTPLATAWAFMFPIFLSSIGFAWVLGSAAGVALAPFGDKAGTAAALLGVFQMSGSGIFVATLQRLPFDAPYIIALHMLLIAPAIVILFSSHVKRWHQL